MFNEEVASSIPKISRWGFYKTVDWFLSGSTDTFSFLYWAYASYLDAEEVQNLIDHARSHANRMKLIVDNNPNLL